jgi:hypothetical protein
MLCITLSNWKGSNISLTFSKVKHRMSTQTTTKSNLWLFQGTTVCQSAASTVWRNWCRKSQGSSSYGTPCMHLTTRLIPMVSLLSIWRSLRATSPFSVTLLGCTNNATSFAAPYSKAKPQEKENTPLSKWKSCPVPLIKWRRYSSVYSMGSLTRSFTCLTSLNATWMP